MTPVRCELAPELVRWKQRSWIVGGRIEPIIEPRDLDRRAAGDWDRPELAESKRERPVAVQRRHLQDLDGKDGLWGARGKASSDQDGPSTVGSRNHLTTIFSWRSTCCSISQPARTKRSTSAWYFRTLGYSRSIDSRWPGRPGRSSLGASAPPIFAQSDGGRFVSGPLAGDRLMRSSIA